MQKKTLSVVIPVYNVEKYLPRCLDSILAQTRLPDEIICVDDGSTDGSGDILNQYEIEHERIKVIYKENGGEVSAKKEALKYATGDYVSFIDSDDWIESNMYKEMLYVAEKTDAEVVTSGLIRDYGENTSIEEEHFDEGFYCGDDLYRVKRSLVDMDVFFQKNILFNVCNKIFQRDQLVKYQNRVQDSISIGEDVAVAYPYILDSQRVYVTGKNYYHYCIRQDSVLGSRDAKKYDSIKQMLEVLQDAFFSHNDIDNSIKQYERIDSYMRLFWRPEDILDYSNGELRFYGKLSPSDRIVIYGAGGFGQCLYEYINGKTDLNIVAWIDKSVRNDIVKSPEEIDNEQYDVVLVAILIADIVRQVKGQLIEKGIDITRIRTICV